MFDKCIICDSDSDLTFEHIIPEALGNDRFGERFLCKRCNSVIGETADSVLCNDKTIATIRLFLGISGKTGGFPKLHGVLDGNSKPVTIVNGKLKQPSFLEEIEKGKLRIHASTHQEAIDMVSRKLKRQGFDEKAIEDSVTKIMEVEPTKVKDPTVVIDIEVDFARNKLALPFIKIAFEYTMYSLGDKYLLDYWGNTLKELLFSYVVNRVNDEYLYGVPIINWYKILEKFVENKLSKSAFVSAKNYQKEKQNLFSVYFPRFFNRCAEFKGVPAHAIRFIRSDKVLSVQIALFCHPLFNYTVPVSIFADEYDIDFEPRIILCRTENIDRKTMRDLYSILIEHKEMLFEFPPIDET